MILAHLHTIKTASTFKVLHDTEHIVLMKMYRTVGFV